LNLFKHIALVYITPTKKLSAFNQAISLAKNYNSKLSLIEYFLKKSPKYFFFETKSEKKAGKIQQTKVREQLKKFKENSAKMGVQIEIHVKSTESIAESILEYVKKNNVDLLIVDHPHVPHFAETHYHAIVNAIHNEIHCNMLTLK